MGYRQEDAEGSGGTLSKKILGFLAFVAAFAAAKALVGSGSDFIGRKNTDPAKVESMLQSDARVASFYQPLKQYFPEDYGKRIAEIAAMIREGASNDEVAVYTFNASRSFVTLHVPEISSATTQTLVQIADAHAAVAEALAQDNTRACAEFGTSGLTPETSKNLSSRAVDELSKAGRLMIVAAHEGSGRRGQRGAELSEQDATALYDAVRGRGLSDQQTEVLFTGKAAEGNILEQCEMTVALYGGIADLETEKSARVMAAILQSV